MFPGLIVTIRQIKKRAGKPRHEVGHLSLTNFLKLSPLMLSIVLAFGSYIDNPAETCTDYHYPSVTRARIAFILNFEKRNSIRVNFRRVGTALSLEVPKRTVSYL